MILPVSVIGMQHIVPKLTLQRIGELVQPEQRGDRMTTMEVLTLLLLLATVIFGILGYIKK